jgi:hypothetical protein
MTTRLQRSLAALLVLQLVLIAVLFWPHAVSGEAGALLTDINSEAVASLTITDDQGKQVTLARQGEGWVLASGGDYPAKGEDIEGVLHQLLAIDRSRLVTRTAASHDRLQVAGDNFVRRIVLTLQDGATRTLYLGVSGGPLTAHVRLEGEDDVFLTNDLTAYDVQATAINWVDPIYLSLVRDDIQSMVLDNPNGRLVFEKSDAGDWTLADLGPDESFNFSSLSTLLSRISALRLDSPVGTEESPEYGLAEPQATVELTVTEDDSASRAVSVRIGTQAEDGTYYVQSSESDYIVKMADFTVEDFITHTRQDFLQPPATPTASP